jgi:hypothetical protein
MCSTVTSSPDPEDIHALYIRAVKTNDDRGWRQACARFLGDQPGPKLDQLLGFLCTDVDEVKCEEFGKTAALLVRKREV